MNITSDEAYLSRSLFSYLKDRRILVFVILMIFRLDAFNISSSSLSIEDMKQFPYCSDYLLTRGFNNRQPSEDELEFPIAYSIVIHSHFGLVERLIRSIWRPLERFFRYN